MYDGENTKFISCLCFGIETEQVAGTIPPFNQSSLILRFLGIFNTQIDSC